MNIKIICPHCQKTTLTDKFSADEVRLFPGGYSVLEMECVECEKYFTLTVETKTEDEGSTTEAD